MRFIVFCLESYKRHKHLTGKEVVDLFQQYDVFGYLTEFFDVLHTAGDSYINHDIDAFLSARNCPI